MFDKPLSCPNRPIRQGNTDSNTGGSSWSERSFVDTCDIWRRGKKVFHQPVTWKRESRDSNPSFVPWRWWWLVSRGRGWGHVEEAVKNEVKESINWIALNRLQDGRNLLAMAWKSGRHVENNWPERWQRQLWLQLTQWIIKIMSLDDSTEYWRRGYRLQARGKRETVISLLG